MSSPVDIDQSLAVASEEAAWYGSENFIKTTYNIKQGEGGSLISKSNPSALFLFFQLRFTGVKPDNHLI